MPEKAMTAMAPTLRLVTPGWKYQMKGSISRPTKAVKTSNTATLLSLKNRSTRYLSKCTEMAQSTGPENAKKTQDIYSPVTARPRESGDPVRNSDYPYCPLDSRLRGNERKSPPQSPVARWPSAWLACRSDGGSTCKSITQTPPFLSTSTPRAMAGATSSGL